MAGLREETPVQLAGRTVERTTDYAAAAAMPVVGGASDEAPQTLPSANVVEFALAGDCKIIVRPSGTEPKIKAYLFAKADSAAAATELLDQLEAAARELLA